VRGIDPSPEMVATQIALSHHDWVDDDHLETMSALGTSK
jgi:hypothetical protein